MIPLDTVDFKPPQLLEEYLRPSKIEIFDLFQADKTRGATQLIDQDTAGK